MRYAPENRFVVELARAVPDEQWNELPIEDLPLGTPLEASLETLSWKTIDKVVSGAEPIRQGYVTKLWRTDDGKLHIVDGHYRVAMYHELGEVMPVRIMDSTLLDRFAERSE